MKQDIIYIERIIKTIKKRCAINMVPYKEFTKYFELTELVKDALDTYFMDCDNATEIYNTITNDGYTIHVLINKKTLEKLQIVDFLKPKIREVATYVTKKEMIIFHNSETKIPARTPIILSYIKERPESYLDDMYVFKFPQGFKFPLYVDEFEEA